MIQGWGNCNVLSMPASMPKVLSTPYHTVLSCAMQLTLFLTDCGFFYTKAIPACVYKSGGSHISHCIPVNCRTKQGGLTSPFIFNLFYQPLVQKLQDSNYGVRIGKSNFNCFCYADDLLLCSTVTDCKNY